MVAALAGATGWPANAGNSVAGGGGGAWLSAWCHFGAGCTSAVLLLLLCRNEAQVGFAVGDTLLLGGRSPAMLPCRCSSTAAQMHVALLLLCKCLLDWVIGRYVIGSMSLPVALHLQLWEAERESNLGHRIGHDGDDGDDVLSS